MGFSFYAIIRINWYKAVLDLKAPVATYRVQLNKTFDFEKLRQLLSYLSQLGISHIYASPIFEAKKGSTHGYDIVDPKHINEELGGEGAFESLMKEASACGIDWIQDIVPNHMSYSLENKMIYDLMQKGSASNYYTFFDVDWNYPSTFLKNKILAPFLTQPYLDCIKQGLIRITNEEDGLKIKYDGLDFPVNVEKNNFQGTDSIKDSIKLVNSDPVLLNGLLSNQFFALAHWKTALKQINYRRFFDIIDLIGVCAENPDVFENIHDLIFQLSKSEKFSGLRIDHVDGLHDPDMYLEKIRQKLPEKYIIVEKILTDNEQLPDSWRVQGTTGYDFLNHINKILINTDSRERINDFYMQFTGDKQSFDDQLYQCKKFVILNYFSGELKNLARLIKQTLSKVTLDQEVTFSDLKKALIELLACFTVYRTYLNQQQHDYEPFRSALKLAKEKNSNLIDELNSIGYLLDQTKTSDEALQAAMRLQQFTGAVMAKGLEDTAFYRYSRFLSTNEVGSNPSQFGGTLEEFHEFNILRQQKWPLSLCALSTHDTKRGEDVRARLNVISEFPEEFKKAVKEWEELNVKKKKRINRKLAPDCNEEYYLYQTLLGSFPWDLNERQEYIERLKLHMVKVLREAKINSNWSSPNLSYEQVVSTFTEGILNSESFLQSFLSLQKKIAFYGFFNTLSQTMLKSTCPGIPDFYQGSELWDLNLVDPDNRRPINFKERQKALSEISNLHASMSSELLERPENGKAKMYVIFKTLQFRRKMKQLFEEGKYIPLAITGHRKKNIFAFARKKENLCAIVIVTRFFTELINPNEAWSKTKIDWGDTHINLPENVSSKWTDVLTNRTQTSEDGTLRVKDVLSAFPVALLFSGEQDG